MRVQMVKDRGVLDGLAARIKQELQQGAKESAMDSALSLGHSMEDLAELDKAKMTTGADVYAFIKSIQFDI